MFFFLFCSIHMKITMEISWQKYLLTSKDTTKNTHKYRSSSVIFCNLFYIFFVWVSVHPSLFFLLYLFLPFFSQISFSLSLNCLYSFYPHLCTKHLGSWRHEMLTRQNQKKKTRWEKKNLICLMIFLILLIDFFFLAFSSLHSLSSYTWLPFSTLSF